MKDQQDPDDDDDEFEPASNSPSEFVPDSGQIGYVQRASSIGPDSPRRLSIDPASPMATVAKVLSLSTTVQLAELQTIAKAFLAEVVERLSCASAEGGGVRQHAPFRQTLERFLAAEDAAVCAKTGTDESDAPVSDTTGAEAAMETAISTMPDFPRFRLGQTFDKWVHELAQTEDVAEMATLLGATSTHTFGRIIIAVTLVHGLPQFRQRCEAGEFTIEHVHAASRVAKDLPFEDLPELDEYLGRRRADVTIETFKKSLAMKAASMQHEDDRSALAARRRRVSITTYEDGTASVTLTGPAAELKAFHQRLEAFARAIRHGNIASLTATDAGDMDVSALGSIDSLMFDIATRVTPQLTIEVTAHDTEHGTSSVTEIPVELPEQGVPTAAAIVNLVNDAAGSAQAEAEHTASDAAGTAAPTDEAAGDLIEQTAGSGGRNEVSTVVKLVMPTHGQWIREQAKMLVTVPFLTLAGQSQLPGIFSDGAPIPAGVARAIAGQCSTWTRIMTDPVTGTPLDARAQSYRIPTDVRLPLTAKWRGCTMPGCTREAETSEVDHIIPFDHPHPALGGQTSFENIHPLCRPHHQAKTDRTFSIRKTSDGSVEYVFSHGVTTEAAPPDNPINARHAELFEGLGPPPDSSRGTLGHPPAPPDQRGSPAGRRRPARNRPPGALSSGSERPNAAETSTQQLREVRQSPKPRRPRKARQSRTERSRRRPDQTVDPWTCPQTDDVRWDSGDPTPF